MDAQIPEIYRLDTYDFELPSELIAQFPVEPRDESRLLLVNRKTESITHHRFKELPGLLSPGDLLVANNSRVIRARLMGHRLIPTKKKSRQSEFERGGKVEFFLLEQKEGFIWEGLMKASANIELGFLFEIPNQQDMQVLRGRVISSRRDSATGTLTVELDQDPLTPGFGEVPLPPYIQRSADQDEESYQTVYAKQAGSSAAPTAGLHFTPRVLESLKARAIAWEEVTLHVGLGTFRPVKELDIRKHPMHEERFWISDETAKVISETHASGRQVVAVGTTSLRTLESAQLDSTERNVHPGEGRTGIFIYPGSDRKVQVVDALLTNFHLPKSTLFMLVCAFGGTELLKRAYREAINEKYRFFSYGDAMLIL